MGSNNTVGCYIIYLAIHTFYQSGQKIHTPFFAQSSKIIAFRELVILVMYCKYSFKILDTSLRNGLEV